MITCVSTKPPSLLHLKPFLNPHAIFGESEKLVRVQQIYDKDLSLLANPQNAQPNVIPPSLVTIVPQRAYPDWCLGWHPATNYCVERAIQIYHHLHRWEGFLVWFACKINIRCVPWDRYKLTTIDTSAMERDGVICNCFFFHLPERKWSKP